jgi:hypothetical protein
MKIYKITEASEYLGVSMNTLKTLAKLIAKEVDFMENVGYQDFSTNSISDAVGNKIFLLRSGDNKYNIFLVLNRDKTLNIGKIEIDRKSHKKTLIKKVNSKHIFNKNDSWGINLSSLHFLQEDDLVSLEYSEGNKHYELTKKQILDKGSFLWFKSTGFEKQIFVPRNEWTLVQQKEASTKLW